MFTDKIARVFQCPSCVRPRVFQEILFQTLNGTCHHDYTCTHCSMLAFGNVLLPGQLRGLVVPSAVTYIRANETPEASNLDGFEEVDYTQPKMRIEGVKSLDWTEKKFGDPEPRDINLPFGGGYTGDHWRPGQEG